MLWREEHVVQICETPKEYNFKDTRDDDGMMPNAQDTEP
jgi:hypothetical protein